MENGGTSTVTMLSDNSSVVIQNTTMQLRSCTNASCDGTITLADTGTIAIATNNATTGITITDSGSGVGAVYTDDYESNFVARSLITKQYVDTEIGNLTGTTSQAITGATNGLTKSGQSVKLGGALTSNTDICTDGSIFKLKNNNDENTAMIFCADASQNLIWLRAADSGWTQCAVVAANKYSAAMWYCDGTISDRHQEIALCADGTYHKSESGGWTFDALGNTGVTATYAADYSSDFVARSLVDKAYVDASAGAIDANNGLTRQGDYITLGGSLTGDTTISGAHTLALSSLTAFNATATNIGLTGVVTATGAVHATSTLGVSGATQIGGTLGVTGALTTTTTAQIGGTLTLDTVTTGDVGTDEVMLITSGGVVKKVAASTLGEDNNIYSKITYTSSQTLTTGSSYVILVNHSVPVTITLPATPLDGQVFKIKDVSSGGALTNNITIGRNGKDMDRTAANALINTDSGALELVYDSALGWFTLAFVN